MESAPTERKRQRRGQREFYVQHLCASSDALFPDLDLDFPLPYSSGRFSISKNAGSIGGSTDQDPSNEILPPSAQDTGHVHECLSAILEKPTLWAGAQPTNDMPPSSARRDPTIHEAGITITVLKPHGILEYNTIRDAEIPCSVQPSPRSLRTHITPPQPSTHTYMSMHVRAPRPYS